VHNGRYFAIYQLFTIHYFVTDVNICTVWYAAAVCWHVTLCNVEGKVQDGGSWPLYCTVCIHILILIRKALHFTAFILLIYIGQIGLNKTELYQNT